MDKWLNLDLPHHDLIPKNFSPSLSVGTAVSCRALCQNSVACNIKQFTLASQRRGRLSISGTSLTPLWLRQPLSPKYTQIFWQAYLKPSSFTASTVFVCRSSHTTYSTLTTNSLRHKTATPNVSFWLCVSKANWQHTAKNVVQHRWLQKLKLDLKQKISMHPADTHFLHVYISISSSQFSCS